MQASAAGVKLTFTLLPRHAGTQALPAAAPAHHEGTEPRPSAGDTPPPPPPPPEMEQGGRRGGASSSSGASVRMPGERALPAGRSDIGVEVTAMALGGEASASEELREQATAMALLQRTRAEVARLKSELGHQA